MAYSGPELKLTGITASTDLSSYQFCLVKMTANGTCELADAATDDPIGVLQNKPESGEEAEIVCIGQTKVMAGATLAAGNRITTETATARAITEATSSYTIGKVIVGANDGELATVIIDCTATYLKA